MRGLGCFVLLVAVAEGSVFFQPQQVSDIQPSDVASLEQQASFGGVAGADQSFNGMPAVSGTDAISQFLARQQEIASEEGGPSNGATDALTPKVMDLEKGAKKGQSQDFGSGIHAAVPKLKQWLSSMDPMTYTAPTFTNPVATQFFNKLSDQKIPQYQREQMAKSVASPYMFNMLGNPAFSDPQLWSGLVSGAAVPYPMRNSIMAQRTKLPFQMATTGTSLTPADEYAMDQYNKAEEDSDSKAAMQPHHKTRHHLFNVIQHLQNKRRADKVGVVMSDRDYLIPEIDNDAEAKRLEKAKKRRTTKVVDNVDLGFGEDEKSS